MLPVEPEVLLKTMKRAYLNVGTVLAPVRFLKSRVLPSFCARGQAHSAKHPRLLSPLELALIVSSMVVVHSAPAQPSGAPPGFTALFNGKDLSGWRGGDTFDHRAWLALREAERSAKNAEWTADMRQHWRIEGDELVNDGNGKYATTES